MIGGIVFPGDFHHLDHLAPLCALWKVPLYVFEEKMEALAEKFYPDLILKKAPIEQIVQEHDYLLTCLPRPLFEKETFLAGKVPHSIWVPHGNSDKGRYSPFMEALQEETHLLIYGPLMEAFLREKGVKGTCIPIGNHRLVYYQKHKKFYESLAPKKSFILYAPTWNDREESSSFLKALPHILKMPDLKIKLHPHLYTQFPEEVKKISSLLIEDFPPIYPLLEKTRVYIGDRSSIGYDFLTFDRPLVFFDSSGEALPLLACGQICDPSELEKALKSPDSYSSSRKALYKKTFGSFL